MTKKPRISAVVAMNSRRAIGKDNKLLWHIPDDLKRFKALTLGHPVIMGRKTFESILASLGHPLPERTNIVATRTSTALSAGDPRFAYENVLVTNSLEDALTKARELDSEEVFIGGGSEIYKQALPHIDKLYLTLIDDDQAGDSYFPPFEREFTKKTFEESREWNGLAYRWVDLERP